MPREPVHAVTPFADEHFERWLERFTGTIDENFVEVTAEVAKGRAIKMARAMRRLLHGVTDDASAGRGGGVSRFRWLRRCRPR